MREGLAEKCRGAVVPHEATHVMKHLKYQPYLDFIERTPNMLNMSSEHAKVLIDSRAEHCKVDLFNMNEEQRTKIYDEINATIFGSYVRGDIVGEALEIANEAFHNFDEYIKELSAIHEQFKAERKALNVNNEFHENNDKASKKAKEKEVDKYCPLAKLRHEENTVVEAQSVAKRARNAAVDVLMKPIGWSDRNVIYVAWGACQAQVEKNGGPKVGTEENKVAAGKLLERVILETQQNSLITERSALMRSKNEIGRSLTMFSADAMKNVGRFFDGIGEVRAIKQELKRKDLTPEERKALEGRLKVAQKKAAKAAAVLIVQAVYMAAIATAFNAIFSPDNDQDEEEKQTDFILDAIGNLFGGIPLVRDVVSFLTDGYEIDSFIYAMANDVLGAVTKVGDVTTDAFSGKATPQEIAKAVRGLFYAVGQCFGIPLKNIYKYTTGLFGIASPDGKYWLDSKFESKPYRADLKRAIEAGDTHMISTIAGLIADENYGGQSKEVRATVRELAAKGHVVLPRTLSDIVTVNNETVKLTDAQKAKMQQVYAASDKAVDELVSMQMFRESTSEEKAKALGEIYDLYYNLAVDHALELDTEERSVLFAEALDVELLAIIAARAGELKADVDKNGKAISGSRKAKVTKLVSSLKLTAAEKYMVMGYLGYRQTHGAGQVKAYINRLDLSKTEKEKLYAYCGYGAAS